MITFYETRGNILNKPKEKPDYSNPHPESEDQSNAFASREQYFEIRTKGQLSNLWADWFEGLSFERLDDGEMLLSGYIADQSALIGVLNKLVRLNLTLISMNEIKNHKEKK